MFSGNIHLTKPKQEWLDEVRILKQNILKEYKSFLGVYKNFPDIVRECLPKEGRCIRDVTISINQPGGGGASRKTYRSKKMAAEEPPDTYPHPP